MVAGASVLVGTQGAGLAQAVFLAQGAAVIEVDSNYCSPVLRRGNWGHRAAEHRAAANGTAAAGAWAWDRLAMEGLPPGIPTAEFFGSSVR